MSEVRRESKIMVTGGGGFLGSHVMTELRERGYGNAVAIRSADYNLVNGGAARAVADVQPEVVIHLAAVVGGIGANAARPGEFFYQNLVMGTELMERSRLSGVQKFVAIGTVCAYPRDTPVPFRESDLWNGYPEETNAPYGLAKKMLLVQGQAYRAQYGFNCIYLLPVNLYGPGDNFDPSSSHVIPAMIRRFLEARSVNQPSVTMWGDGSPTREFLYVADAARGIVDAMERYDGAEPVNLGSSNEISIADLASEIARAVGFEGKIEWDLSKPNGQPRRKLDVSKAQEFFGFRSTVGFDEGLRRTLEWYRSITDPPAINS